MRRPPILVASALGMVLAACSSRAVQPASSPGDERAAVEPERQSEARDFEVATTDTALEDPPPRDQVVPDVTPEDSADDLRPEPDDAERTRAAVVEEGRVVERNYQRCMELSFRSMPKSVASNDSRALAYLHEASDRCWKIAKCDYLQAHDLPPGCSMEYRPE